MSKEKRGTFPATYKGENLICGFDMADPEDKDLSAVTISKIVDGTLQIIDEKLSTDPIEIEKFIEQIKEKWEENL